MSEPTLHCSFCSKSQHDVRTLIEGPNVFICDECVEICRGILRDHLGVGCAKYYAALSLGTWKAIRLLRKATTNHKQTSRQAVGCPLFQMGHKE